MNSKLDINALIGRIAQRLDLLNAELLLLQEMKPRNLLQTQADGLKHITERLHQASMIISNPENIEYETD